MNFRIKKQIYELVIEENFPNLEEEITILYKRTIKHQLGQRKEETHWEIELLKY